MWPGCLEKTYAESLNLQKLDPPIHQRTIDEVGASGIAICKTYVFLRLHGATETEAPRRSVKLSHARHLHASEQPEWLAKDV